MIISKYILRNLVGPFLFGTLTVLFLINFQFILKYIDKLVGKGLSEWVIIQLILINTAWMVILAVPMGVLFSSLMAFGGMSSTHEVTIVKASGGSLLKMMAPVFIAGIFVTAGLFWFNDEILPEANHKAKVLMSDIRRKKPTFSIESGRFSTDIGGYTILSRTVDSLSGKLSGVTIYDNSKRGFLNVISADSGIVKSLPEIGKLSIDLYQGEIHQLKPLTLDNNKIIDFKKYRIFITAKGFDFERSDEGSISRSDREMPIREMQIIVDDANVKANQSMLRIDSNFSTHLDYLFSGYEKLDDDQLKRKRKEDELFKEYEDIKRPIRRRFPEKIMAKRNLIAHDSARSEKIPVEKDSLDLADEQRIEALKNVQKRLSFLRSTVSSDVYMNKDYNRTVRKFEVEIQKKYALPFACIVFLLVGCPLGVMTKGGNFGISAAICIGFYFIYWACLIGGEKLADRGFISTFMSMWLGNFLVGFLGIILTIKVNNETVRLPKIKLFNLLKRKS